MKKSIFLVIIIFVILILGLVNKTFFAEKYLILNGVNNVVYLPIPKFSIFLSENNKKIKLYTFKKEETINKFVNNYFKNLESCYDGNYYYDHNRKVTIMDYSYNDNIITIKYSQNNICSKEHELSSNWSSKFNEAEFKYIKYNNKDIDVNKFKEFINSFSNYELHRYNNDIKINENYHLKAEFVYDNKTYKVDITHLKKDFVGIKISYDNKFESAKFKTSIDNLLEDYFN